jgi:hypothetical protein
VGPGVVGPGVVGPGVVGPGVVGPGVVGPGVVGPDPRLLILVALDPDPLLLGPLIREGS